MMRELLRRIWKKDEGFSLIELIIVIAILAIIGAIAVPNVLGNIKKANNATDVSNAKLIADAIATTVAQNPEWVGTAIAADTQFTSDADLDAPVDDYADDIINAAIVNLNNNIPTLKSNDNGTADSNFVIAMTDAGVITIVSDTGTALFPTPAN